MSAQMVLLPVFVLVGLTFALLLWMAGGAPAGAGWRGNQGQGYRARTAELAHPRDRNRQLLQKPVRAAAVVLHPDRAGAAAAPRRSVHRADVMGVRGHALRSRWNFRDLQRSEAALAGVVRGRAGGVCDVDLFRAEDPVVDLMRCSRSESSE